MAQCIEGGEGGLEKQISSLGKIALEAFALEHEMVGLLDLIAIIILRNFGHIGHKYYSDDHYLEK